MAKSGNAIYGDLERALAQARETLDRAGRDVERRTDELEEVQAAEARTLAQLAKIRLGELDGNRVAGGLDAADRHALQLLAQRRGEAEDVRAQIEACDEEQRALEAERADATEARDAALEAHDDQVEATLARVAQTEEHQFQRSRAERAAALAARAGAKAQQAEEDRDRKRVAYDESKLFSYLWRRRYRFPEYRANLLVRALDGWVARLCAYERAHRDYAMLLEIPARLRAHAEARAADAHAEAAALEQIESAALEADGVPALADALAEQEARLDEIEVRIERAEQRRAALLDRRAALEAGEDAHSREALSALGAQLAREDVATLQADSRRTGTPADDALVAEIADLRARTRRLEGEVEAARTRQGQALAALRDLEEMRRRFRRSRYDASDSIFDDDFDAGRLFGGLLHGALVFGDVWARLGRHQRFRRRGGGLGSGLGRGGGLGGLGGVLSGGLSRGGFGGFGGGFRTGGGFGGGGFRTGGGF